MAMKTPATGANRPQRLLARSLRLHVIAYCVIMGGVLIANVVIGGYWWSFWPTIVWGLVLAVHFFIVKSMLIDDDWVAERSLDLRDKSYDFGHIEDIKQRIVTRDPSVRPADERD